MTEPAQMCVAGPRCHFDDGRKGVARSPLTPATPPARQRFRRLIPIPLSGAREILIEARRDGDQVLLSVTDHGPGIPESDRKHAVERFVRLEASRTQPGSGLGLSLASAVATLHGGDLRLGDAHPGLRATLAIPALAAVAGDRLAAQTPDVPQKVA